MRNPHKKTTLFVCHSTGDADALLATAQKALEKRNEIQIYFLIIGKAKSRACELKEDELKASGQVKFTRLSGLLGAEIESLDYFVRTSIEIEKNHL